MLLENRLKERVLFNLLLGMSYEMGNPPFDSLDCLGGPKLALKMSDKSVHFDA